MATLTDLEVQVAAVKDVEDSAIALLTGLHAQLTAALASGDPAAIQKVIDELGANKDALASAVVANT